LIEHMHNIVVMQNPAQPVGDHSCFSVSIRITAKTTIKTV